MHYLDCHEDAQHGTHKFPLAYYCVSQNHPRYQMPYHWHKEYEIIHIREGSLNLSLDGEEIAAEQGDILFIPGGAIHGGTPQHSVYECVVFDLGILPAQTEAQRTFMRQITSQEIAVFSIFSSEFDNLRLVTENLFSCVAAGSYGFELMASGYLCLFFGIIFTEHLYTLPEKKPLLQQKRMAPFRQVLEYIEQNYASPVSLSTLSRIAGMSPKYFCRYFYTATHQTPIEYLNYYRVERACLELASSDLSITEVGYRCGFKDTSYFIRVFKKQTGMSPGKYRHCRASSDSSR